MGVDEKKKPKITLYEHVNFKGRSKTFTEANDNLIDEGFNDYSSSVIVEGGVWVLYQHCNYTGNVCVVIEGDRTNLLNCRGDKGTKIHDFNDVVSSLKPLDYDNVDIIPYKGKMDIPFTAHFHKGEKDGQRLAHTSEHNTLVLLQISNRKL
ncbi:unnamed protein product [Mytilus edulis]|uniref:Beta/gamma crystallin 'Greek key' domain-containing protein n=1 Tax=Mytilus edulis TaxID=6550 RepID=A0A8S3PZK0_MYTED|nr:unnamed protein product [Mytilus edulis]